MLSARDGAQALQTDGRASSSYKCSHRMVLFVCVLSARDGGLFRSSEVDGLIDGHTDPLSEPNCIGDDITSCTLFDWS